MESTELGMIDRSKLPDFFKDFSEERLKELMMDENPKDFNEAMDKLLNVNKKKQDGKK